jgi:hypothetical protein
LVWLRKYDALDWSNPKIHQMSKSKETPVQKIKRLERELVGKELRNLLLNTMIVVSDKIDLALPLATISYDRTQLHESLYFNNGTYINLRLIYAIKI